MSAAAQASVTAVKVRKGDVRRAVIVRTRKAVRRPDGRIIRFDDNAAVLLNNKREMLGTRIGGVISADLRMKGWGKIASLAPKVRLLLCLRQVELTRPLDCVVVGIPRPMYLDFSRAVITERKLISSSRASQDVTKTSTFMFSWESGDVYRSINFTWALGSFCRRSERI